MKMVLLSGLWMACALGGSPNNCGPDLSSLVSLKVEAPDGGVSFVRQSQSHLAYAALTFLSELDASEVRFASKAKKKEFQARLKGAANTSNSVAALEGLLKDFRTQALDPAKEAWLKRPPADPESENKRSAYLAALRFYLTMLDEKCSLLEDAQGSAMNRKVLQATYDEIMVLLPIYLNLAGVKAKVTTLVRNGISFPAVQIEPHSKDYQSTNRLSRVATRLRDRYRVPLLVSPHFRTEKGGVAAPDKVVVDLKYFLSLGKMTLTAGHEFRHLKGNDLVREGIVSPYAGSVMKLGEPGFEGLPDRNFLTEETNPYGFDLIRSKKKLADVLSSGKLDSYSDFKFRQNIGVIEQSVDMGLAYTKASEQSFTEARDAVREQLKPSQELPLDLFVLESPPSQLKPQQVSKLPLFQFPGKKEDFFAFDHFESKTHDGRTVDVAILYIKKGDLLLNLPLKDAAKLAPHIRRLRGLVENNIPESPQIMEALPPELYEAMMQALSAKIEFEHSVAAQYRGVQTHVQAYLANPSQETAEALANSPFSIPMMDGRAPIIRP